MSDKPARLAPMLQVRIYPLIRESALAVTDELSEIRLVQLSDCFARQVLSNCTGNNDAAYGEYAADCHSA